jgi:hypothetical protein
VIDRLMEAERLIMDLRARVAAAENRLVEIGQSTGKLWGAVTSGPGGLGGGAYVSLAIPAIPASGQATGDVYILGWGGAFVLDTAGAGILNPYNNATTAGRVCTLARNVDGSFTVLGQSCT